MTLEKNSRMTINDLPIGTEIYYRGDMANNPGFGVITGHGKNTVDIRLEDGRIQRRIYVIMFSTIDTGDGLSRFVTKKAYFERREKQLAKLMQRIEG